MKIQIPENIDLSHCERYILTIEVHPEQFSFSLYNPIENSSYFYHRIEKSKQEDAFSSFQSFFFDNELLTLSFRKIFVINYTSVFTYVPTLIFDEKDKNQHLDFIFSEVSGKVLHQNLQRSGITIIHEIPVEIYDFFQRSFVNAQFVHHTAVLITYFQEKGHLSNGNRMIVNKQKNGIDILCFSRDSLLLGNHFPSSGINDAVYYILFIWKQLKFNQMKDFIYIAGDVKELMEPLKKYIHNIIPVSITPTEHFEQINTGIIPFEMASLSLCEL